MTMKWNLVRVAGLLTVSVMLGACAPAPAKIQSGPDAEISYDGLVRVDNTKMSRVWLRPDIDLNGYSRVLPVVTNIQFASARVLSRGMAMRLNQENFPLSDDEKARFELAAREIFAAEFASSKKFQLADQPGEDVLLVQLEILNVRSTVPPEGAGTQRVYVRSVGDAELVVELYDSQSRQILARAMDKREFDFPGDQMQLSSKGLSEARVRRGLQAWARIMVDGLESMKK